MRLRVTASAQFMASAYGCSGEHVRRRDRDTQLETPHPVSPLVHNLAVPANAQATSGRVRPAPFREQPVDSDVGPGGRPPIRSLDVFQNTAPITIARGGYRNKAGCEGAFHGVLSISLRLPSALLYAPMRTLGGRGLPKVSGDCATHRLQPCWCYASPSFLVREEQISRCRRLQHDEVQMISPTQCCPAALMLGICLYASPPQTPTRHAAPQSSSSEGLRLLRKMQEALGGAERMAAVRDVEEIVRAEARDANGSALG